VFCRLWFPCCSFRGSWLLCTLPNASLFREIQTWCTSLRMASICMSLSIPTHMGLLTSSHTSLLTSNHTNLLTSSHTSLLTSNHTSLSTSSRMNCLASSSCRLRMLVMSLPTTSFQNIQICLRKSRNCRQMNCSPSFLGELQLKRQVLPRRE